MTDSDETEESYDPSVLTGAAAERYFELLDALMEFSKLFDYDEKNDRSIAIVGATFVDTLLEHILLGFLVDDVKEVGSLLKYDQPLGTYGGRTKMVYCLGLMNKAVYHDVRLVGKIRNRFAHDLYASFEDDKIRSWCYQLQWHKIAYVANPPADATARALFQVGVHQVVTYLHGMVSIARNGKRLVDRY